MGTASVSQVSFREVKGLGQGHRAAKGQACLPACVPLRPVLHPATLSPLLLPVFIFKGSLGKENKAALGKWPHSFKEGNDDDEGHPGA